MSGGWSWCGGRVKAGTEWWLGVGVERGLRLRLPGTEWWLEVVVEGGLRLRLAGSEWWLGGRVKVEAPWY